MPTTLLTLLALIGLLGPAQEPASSPPPDFRCAGFTEVTVTTEADLACIELFAPLRGGDAHGIAQLARVQSPFGVAVTAAGRHRFRVRLWLDRLPDLTDPEGLEYVAWAMPLTLDPQQRLGIVHAGMNELGEVSFSKFIVMVSAEPVAGGPERQGPMVLRGSSPSSRMQPEDLITQSPLALIDPAAAAVAAGSADGVDPGDHHEMAGSPWSMPPMHPEIPPMLGMRGLAPRVAPYLPAVDPQTLPMAQPRQLVRLPDGGTLDLEATLVRREIGGRSYPMYGFNGQHPGPLIHVPERATIFVNFTNRTDLPTAVHWHGVRLDNRYDGVPGLTQDPVLPGESFRYEVFFRDPGIYWYHPHHREDITQDLGLYGNMLVDPLAPEYYSPVNREEVVMLDDILIGPRGFVPYGAGSANYMLMGRFGNVFLLNGEPDYSLDVDRGEVVRFFFTNVANTRTFNLVFQPDGGRAPLPIKVVATDVSRFEHEQWAESLVIAPAERYVVEVRFPEAGTVTLANQVQAIDHRAGAYFAERNLLGRVEVSDGEAVDDHAAAHAVLRDNADVIADIARYSARFDDPPDRELVLRLDAEGLPLVIEQLMAKDRAYFNPVEWSGTMPMMNWATTAEEIRWNLIDPRSVRRNLEIDDWKFSVGDVVKVRVTNDRSSFHAMQHPIHFHGQRFVVLEQDGVRSDNMAWKDTVLLPVGSVTDLLLEISNPGKWMVHCHIAEHLESGMKMVFEARPRE